MAARRLRLPEDVREHLARRYARSRAEWIAGGGAWPLDITLGTPTERDAMEHRESVLAWVDAWRKWRGVGTLAWRERRWPTAGVQRIPHRLTLDGPGDVAAWLGETARWDRARGRYAVLLDRWPPLANVLHRHFDLLAGYSEDDFDRLLAMTSWLDAHRASGLYPRQLPVPGVDSKWFEAHEGVLREWSAAIRGEEAQGRGVFEITGLRRPPVLLRVRILDPVLRCSTGGLADVSAPVEQWAALAWPVHRVFVVENVQTGLAFEDLPGSVAIVGRGYSLNVLSAIPWLNGTPCHYWGDLDTHGFVMLDQAREYVPNAASLLMDGATLLAHRPLWGREPEPSGAALLPRLTLAERAVYEGLKQHRWGTNVRLEQERIPWPYAWERIRRVAGATPNA